MSGAFPSVLVVEHAATCPPGLFAAWLVGEGIRLDVRRPYEGDPLPDRLEHDGLLVLGGPMAAWEDAAAPWLPATRELLRRAVQHGTPTLGICLGGQLLALALGGEVTPAPHGPELGAPPVRPRAEAAGDALLGWLPPAGVRAVQWHSDAIVRLPDAEDVSREVVWLAEGDAYPCQAFRVGDAVWGVQFHPEATPGIVARWRDEESAHLVAAGVDMAAPYAEVEAWAAREPVAWRPLAEHFAERVRTASPSPPRAASPPVVHDMPKAWGAS